ncbi:MAG: hypothetical protein IT497_10430 [Ottowia sp.]|nr:hypothetical protein [Ottowia sp.]
MSEKINLTETVSLFPHRLDERPKTVGPAPNRQVSQFPEDRQWEDILFAYVKAFPGVEVDATHIGGDGSEKAFFLPQYQHLKGFQNKFLVDNEFAHIHKHESSSLHAVLPIEIGQIITDKKWGEPHPLSLLGEVSETNHLLYGARNAQETQQLKVLLRISYLFATNNW